MAERNSLLASPFRHTIQGLKEKGYTYEDIAEFLNDAEERTGDDCYSSGQVYNYLSSALDTTKPEARLALTRQMKEARYQNRAEEAFKIIDQEFAVARASGDFKAIAAMSKELATWFDKGMKADGLEAGPSSLTALQINIGGDQRDKEKDALIDAVKEWLADNPNAWTKIVLRAKVIAGGAVPGTIDVDVVPESLKKDDALPDV